MDVLEVPGCPEGSLKVANYIGGRSPAEFTVKTPDEDCVKVLQVILPLLGYAVAEVKRTDKYELRIKKSL